MNLGRWSAGLGLTLVSLSVLPAGAQPSPGAAVETLAGPGFCQNSSVRSAVGRQIRAIAVDHDGRLFLDTGPPQAGTVGIVESDGGVRLRATGIPAGGRSSDGSTDASDPPTPERLAADGNGGFFVAAGSRIVDFVQVPGSSNGGLRAPPELAPRTIAGDPSGPATAAGAGSSGDGGPATEARFDSARSVATDETGNLFVTDLVPKTGLFRVRVINRGTRPVTFFEGTPQQVAVDPGTIATVAGSAGGAAAPPPGPALQVSLGGVPPAVAVHGGILYIAALGRAGGGGSPGHVWMVNLKGTPVRAHGATAGPGAAAIVASSPYVPGLAADDTNLYLAEPTLHRVVKIGDDGIARTFAGGIGAGFNGNERPAAGATLSEPYDVAVGPNSSVYLSDRLNGQVRMVDGAEIIHAFPGSGLASGSTCLAGSGTRSTPEAPEPGGPAGVAADDAGTVYASLGGLAQVVSVDASGVVRTVIGRQRPPCTTPRCPAPAISKRGRAPGVLVRPTALAMRTGGGFYVLDEGSRRVWFANFTPKALTVNGVRAGAGAVVAVAGNGGSAPEGDGDGGKALGAALGNFASAGNRAGAGSGSLATDAGGDLFISSEASGRVRMVDRAGTITTVVGKGSTIDTSRCCSSPVAVAADAGGNLYVAEVVFDPNRPLQRWRIWFVNRTPAPVTALGRRVEAASVSVVAGNGEFGDADEGTRATESALLDVVGLALDRQGDLYLAEQGVVAYGPDIRRIDITGTTSTVAGNGGRGFNGDGLIGRLTSLDVPTALAVDGCGNVVFADVRSDRVRRLGGPCTGRVRAHPKGSSRAWWPLVPVALAAGVVGGTLVGARRRRTGVLR